MSLGRELKKGPAAIGRLLAMPLYLLAAAILSALRIRLFCVTTPDRIGHLALEPDCYLKDLALGRIPPARTVLLATSGAAIANPCLLDYWRRHMTVVSNPIAVALLSPMRKRRSVWVDAGRYVVSKKKAAACYATYAAWGDRPPILELDPEHRARGEEALRKLKIPSGAWFVCVHSREPGYTVKDDALHAYRNSSIDDYRLAMQEIVARGGWCVRMGDPSGAAFEAMPGVVDYAHSPLRSDWMDIFLCARCRFFLGSTSGLFLVSSAFGIPVALAQMAPLGAAWALAPMDLSIPKLVADLQGKCQPFRRVFEFGAARFRSTEAFAREKLQVIDNSGEEIRDLTVEMLDRLEGRAHYDANDERLQDEFRGLLTPSHYSFGSVARIGRDFLRRHADLLTDRQEALASAAGE